MFRSWWSSWQLGAEGVNAFQLSFRLNKGGGGGYFQSNVAYFPFIYFYNQSIRFIDYWSAIMISTWMHIYQIWETCTRQWGWLVAMGNLFAWTAGFGVTYLSVVEHHMRFSLSDLQSTVTNDTEFIMEIDWGWFFRWSVVYYCPVTLTTFTLLRLHKFLQFLKLYIFELKSTVCLFIGLGMLIDLSGLVGLKESTKKVVYIVWYGNAT